MLMGCPLTLEDPYVIADSESPRDAAVDDGAGVLQPEDGAVSDSAREAAVDDGSPEGAGEDVVSVDAGADDAPEQVLPDGGEPVEPDAPPACGKPCGTGCETLCAVGEPCGKKHDCVEGASCRKDDTDQKVCIPD